MNIADNNVCFNDYKYAAAAEMSLINNCVISELLLKKMIVSHRDIFEEEFWNKIKGVLLTSKSTEKLRILKKSDDKITSRALSIEDECGKNNIYLVSRESVYYPYGWTTGNSFPQVFFAKGNLQALLKLNYGSIAVVGSRSPSNYAVNATEEVVRFLTSKDVVIVSGMAYGIDRVAHLNALNTDGTTIAVLAGGVDHIYPYNNKDIYDRICETGVVISELTPGMIAKKQYFPSRNRLISGISDCTFISEAGELSGTLHTASFAASQGKAVFVLPNTIYCDYAKGGLKLIQDGAQIYLDSEQLVDEIARCTYYRLLDINDIHGDNAKIMLHPQSYRELERLSWSNAERLDDNDWKKLILGELTVKPLDAEEFKYLVNLPYFKLAEYLSELELNDLILFEKGKYALKNKL